MPEGQIGYRLRTVPLVAAHNLHSGQDIAITSEPDPSLNRTQRRRLRRIYNGRTVPIIVDGRSFLTFKEASRYLLTLTIEAREKACAEMSSSAANGPKIQA